MISASCLMPNLLCSSVFFRWSVAILHIKILHGRGTGALPLAPAAQSGRLKVVLCLVITDVRQHGGGRLHDGIQPWTGIWKLQDRCIYIHETRDTGAQHVCYIFILSTDQRRRLLHFLCQDLACLTLRTHII